MTLLLASHFKEIAWRPKEAAQHGAGIHHRLVALAEEQGFNEPLAERIGYHMEKELEETLGSSQRYGFKYEAPNHWATHDHVQLWLDNLAYKHNLLSREEREQLEPYLQQAAALIHHRYD